MAWTAKSTWSYLQYGADRTTAIYKARGGGSESDVRREPSVITQVPGRSAPQHSIWAGNAEADD